MHLRHSTAYQPFIQVVESTIQATVANTTSIRLLNIRLTLCKPNIICIVHTLTDQTAMVHQKNMVIRSTMSGPSASRKCCTLWLSPPAPGRNSAQWVSCSKNIVVQAAKRRLIDLMGRGPTSATEKLLNTSVAEPVLFDRSRCEGPAPP